MSPCGSKEDSLDTLIHFQSPEQVWDCHKQRNSGDKSRWEPRGCTQPTARPGHHPQHHQDLPAAFLKKDNPAVFPGIPSTVTSLRVFPGRAGSLPCIPCPGRLGSAAKSRSSSWIQPCSPCSRSCSCANSHREGRARGWRRRFDLRNPRNADEHLQHGVSSQRGGKKTPKG